MVPDVYSLLTKFCVHLSSERFWLQEGRLLHNIFMAEADQTSIFLLQVCNSLIIVYLPISCSLYQLQIEELLHSNTFPMPIHSIFLSIHPIINKINKFSIFMPIHPIQFIPYFTNKKNISCHFN